MPDIPTMREQGYDMVVKNPTVIRRLSDSGVTIVTSKSPEDFTALLKSENERFARAIREGKIQTE